MHRGVPTWLSISLALLVTCAATAKAQQGDDVFGLAADGPAAAVSSEPGEPARDAPIPRIEDRLAEPIGPGESEGDLAARVKQLEAALQKIQGKQEADLKKAAGAPTVKPFGKIHWDSATFSQNPAGIAQAGDMLNGTEFRRARIGVQGDAFQALDYRIEMDFAGEVAFKDVYVTFKNLPWLGNVRAGHFKECFSLEILNSDDYTTFMERSLIDGGGVLGHLGDRNPGVMVFDYNEAETCTWQYGVFAAQAQERPPIFPKTTVFDDNGGAAFDVRATCLPWWDDGNGQTGRRLLHLGAAYSYRDIATLSPSAPANSVRYSLSSLPESNLANAVVDTGALNDTDHVNALRPELALVHGPFSLQTEYMWFWLARTQHANPTFDGGYMSLSYLLTGESRNYERQRGNFRSVVPFENFLRVRGDDGCITTGRGAWEVAYRISYLNLTDAGVQGGRVVDHTFGLNWYLNPNARLMFNLVHSETTDRRNPAGGVFARGIADIFETRVQMTF